MVLRHGLAKIWAGRSDESFANTVKRGQVAERKCGVRWVRSELARHGLMLGATCGKLADAVPNVLRELTQDVPVPEQLE